MINISFEDKKLKNISQVEMLMIMQLEERIDQ